MREATPIRWLNRTLGPIAALVLLASSLTASPIATAQSAPRGKAIGQTAPLRPPLVPTAAGVPGGPAPASLHPSGGRAAWPGTAVQSFGFYGIPRISPAWPGDPTGAVGDSFFVTAVNVHVAVYDLNGSAILGPLPLASSFSFPSGTQVFDPKVVYDHYTGHFVLAFLAYDGAQRKSWILLITMPDATAGIPATWCERKIPADRLAGDGKQWADYPGLGFDVNRVTLTTNQFDFGPPQVFRYAQVLSFAKTGLYDCSQPTGFRLFTGNKTKNPNGSAAFTMQPAVSVGVSAADQYLLSFRRTGTDTSTLTLWRLGSVGGKLDLANVSMASGPVRVAPYGTQGGGGLLKASTWWDTGDLRLVNAFYDADRNRIYAAHAVGKDLLPDPVTGGYEESVIRWYEVEPAANLVGSTITRKGIVGTPETDAGWPVVATDGSGNIFIGYSRASVVTGEYLSAWIAEIPHVGVAATTTLLATGTARFEASSEPERWGDFNAISRDPVDSSFITVVDQIALADGSGPTKNWQQTVSIVAHG